MLIVNKHDDEYNIVDLEGVVARGDIDEITDVLDDISQDTPDKETLYITGSVPDDEALQILLGVKP